MTEPKGSVKRRQVRKVRNATPQRSRVANKSDWHAPGSTEYICMYLPYSVPRVTFVGKHGKMHRVAPSVSVSQWLLDSHMTWPDSLCCPTCLCDAALHVSNRYATQAHRPVDISAGRRRSDHKDWLRVLGCPVNSYRRGGAPAQAPELPPTHGLLQQTFNVDSLRVCNFSSITRMQRCLPGMAGNPTFATHRTAQKRYQRYQRHHRSTHDTANPCGIDDNATTPCTTTSRGAAHRQTDTGILRRS